MTKFLFSACVLVTLMGCSSPPKPPSCDGANRRPVNQDKATAQQARGQAVNAASYFNCMG
jgi:hypothetical protein